MVYYAVSGKFGGFGVNGLVFNCEVWFLFPVQMLELLFRS